MEPTALDGRSTLLDSTHEAYEPARRIWNGMIDRKPAFIARCSSVWQIQSAIQFAKREGLPLSVRGGGHNIAGNSICDQRDYDFERSIIANWTDPAQDDQNIQWARQLWRNAQPFVSKSVYLNHLTADEPEERVIAAYGQTKYEKLAELKRKYDPDNLFCSNHNVKPAAA